MAAKFASFTALLLLGTVANVAEPVCARAIEGRQVVSSTATAPAGTTAVPSFVSSVATNSAGTTAVPSSDNVITVSICSHPATATVSSALAPKAFAYNTVGNGTLSLRAAPRVPASSGGPVVSPTGSIPIESPTSVVTDTVTNSVSPLLPFSGLASILASIRTQFPTTGSTSDVVTVNSVLKRANPSSVPPVSITTVHYDCGSSATASVSSAAAVATTAGPVVTTSAEATASAVPTISNVFKRE